MWFEFNGLVDGLILLPMTQASIAIIQLCVFMSQAGLQNKYWVSYHTKICSIEVSDQLFISPMLCGKISIVVGHHIVFGGYQHTMHNYY